VVLAVRIRAAPARTRLVSYVKGCQSFAHIGQITFGFLGRMAGFSAFVSGRQLVCFFESSAYVRAVHLQWFCPGKIEFRSLTLTLVEGQRACPVEGVFTGQALVCTLSAPAILADTRSIRCIGVGEKLARIETCTAVVQA